MNISCPSCSTRYALPSSDGMPLAITCRVCGHHWREDDVVEAIDITEHAEDLPAVIDHDDAPEFESRRLAQLAADAHARHAEHRAIRRRNHRQWAMFAALLALPLAAAAAVPEAVVATAPISIVAYEALGYDINLRGLEIRSVENQHAQVGDKRILAVKGEIHNITGSNRKVPGLIFTLTNADGEEVYTWPLDTGSQSLRPGEATGFISRVEAPPEAARNVKIRFAEAGEIGSSRGDFASQN